MLYSITAKARQQPQERQRPRIAAVEGGGTTFCVAICEIIDDDPLPRILVRTDVDSSHDNPKQTLQVCAAWIHQHGPIDALGIATFGPVGVNPAHPGTYGKILATSPKAAWRNVDVLTPLRQACQNDHVAVLVETDVNAPALAEYEWEKRNNNNSSNASCLSSLAYITVGTGVGVGLVVNHQAVHGRMHPEGGHVLVQPLSNDTFPGYSWGKEHSPFEGLHTVEGLASTVALTERLLYDEQQQQQASPATVESSISIPSSTSSARNILADLPDDHAVFDHAANALANLCVTLLLTVSVEKIVLGGGLMRRANSLLPKIHQRTVVLLNGYLDLPTTDMSSLITTSQYGNDAGLIGAVVLAQRAWLDKQQKQQASESNTHDNDDEHQIRIKQEAFGYGLRHGLVVGAVVTALIAKYYFGVSLSRSVSGGRRR